MREKSTETGQRYMACLRMYMSTVRDDGMHTMLPTPVWKPYRTGSLRYHRDDAKRCPDDQSTSFAIVLIYTLIMVKLVWLEWFDSTTESYTKRKKNGRWVHTTPNGKQDSIM
jgi:hypothetical protein